MCFSASHSKLVAMNIFVHNTSPWSRSVIAAPKCMNTARPFTRLPELFTKGLYQFTLPLTKDESAAITVFKGSAFQSSYTIIG